MLLLPDGNRQDRLAARGRGVTVTPRIPATGFNTSVSSAVCDPSIGVFITRIRWPRAIRCQRALLYSGALCLRAAFGAGTEATFDAFWVRSRAMTRRISS